MVTLERLRELTLSFPETTEEQHFEKTSFSVKKKLFATYDPQKKITCVKLNVADQEALSSSDIIYPIQNSSDEAGWTNVDMGKVHKDMFKEALTKAYCEAAPLKLATMVQEKET